MEVPAAARLWPGAIGAVLETHAVTPATRATLLARLAWTPRGAPQCFGANDFATLEAICERLIPQHAGSRPVDLASRLDARLGAAVGDGWRYDAMPPDRLALTEGVQAVDRTAFVMFRSTFRFLAPVGQDKVLKAVQDGSEQSAWGSLSSARFFEEILTQLVELYYAHPYAQERIGYVGMADAGGFSALGLNRRDPVEQEASDAPL